MDTAPEAGKPPLLDIRFDIKSWDEKPFQELADGHKLTQANVPLSVADPRIQAEASLIALMHYNADGVSSYVAVVPVDGHLDGRAGSFVLMGTGTYDKTQARLDLSVVPGSGTGELAGIRGSATSVSTHEDFPQMPMTLSYQLG